MNKYIEISKGLIMSRAIIGMTCHAVGGNYGMSESYYLVLYIKHAKKIELGYQTYALRDSDYRILRGELLK